MLYYDMILYHIGWRGGGAVYSLAWLSRPFRPFSVLPFCRFGIALVLLRFPLSVSPFWPTRSFNKFHFPSRAPR